MQKLSGLFGATAIGIAVAVGGVTAIRAHRLSEQSENIRLGLLSKGYNENQALCVKKEFNSWPYTETIFANGNKINHIIAEAHSTCGLPAPQ